MITQTADVRSTIRKADDAFEETFGRGDAAGMAALYTEDGMLLPTGSYRAEEERRIRRLLGPVWTPEVRVVA